MKRDGEIEVMGEMVKKRGGFFFLLLMALAILAAGCSQTQPQVEVESATIDLGDVPNGVIETRQIAVRNSGAGDLVIHSISTSCGCTEAVVTPDTIPPGGEGILEIAFDSGAHGPELTGPMMRQVFLNTNDAANPEVVVEVTVNVLPRVGALP